MAGGIAWPADARARGRNVGGPAPDPRPHRGRRACPAPGEAQSGYLVRGGGRGGGGRPGLGRAQPPAPGDRARGAGRPGRHPPAPRPLRRPDGLRGPHGLGPGGGLAAAAGDRPARAARAARSPSRARAAGTPPSTSRSSRAGDGRGATWAAASSCATARCRTCRPTNAVRLERGGAADLPRRRLRPRRRRCPELAAGLRRAGVRGARSGPGPPVGGRAAHDRRRRRPGIAARAGAGRLLLTHSIREPDRDAALAQAARAVRRPGRAGPARARPVTRVSVGRPPPRPTDAPGPDHRGPAQPAAAGAGARLRDAADAGAGLVRRARSLVGVVLGQGEENTGARALHGRSRSRVLAALDIALVMWLDRRARPGAVSGDRPDASTRLTKWPRDRSPPHDLGRLRARRRRRRPGRGGAADAVAPLQGARRPRGARPPDPHLRPAGEVRRRPHEQPPARRTSRRPTSSRTACWG